MDFDSSAKFISSLAKFLQSLCNGYVEFDNGVEVIGHIYLNVDTGKKIDYVLNEKVCKTDENSVTFISNSFHAQPAEKPKPIEKPKQKITTEIEQETDNEIILMEDSDKSYEQYGDNVQHNSSPHPKPPRSHGASKRSYSQSFASNRSSKAVKFDSTSSSNPNGAHLPSPSNNSTNDSSFNVSGNITAASESDLSHLSQVFPETVDPSNAQDRDIKPILDKDLNVINVKQEYDPSAEGQGDGGTYDDQGDGSYYSQDQMYESGNEYYGSGHRNSTQRSDYDPSKLYLGEAGTSGSTGDAPDYDGHALWQPGHGCPVPNCVSHSLGSKFKDAGNFRKHWAVIHMPLSVSHICALCGWSSKRRDHVIQHYQVRHGVYGKAANPRMERRPNGQYINPLPLTLHSLLRRQ